MTVEIAKDKEGYLKINLGDGWRYIIWVNFNGDNTVEVDTSLIKPIKLPWKNEAYKQFAELMGVNKKGGEHEDSN